MDQFVQAFASKQAFMGSVLIARGNEVLLSKGYGFANLEWNMPNSPATKFTLASVTKQFTAAAILLLEERGKLKTSDPVKSLMPDAPPAWDHITIFHLLTHTSGIPNFTTFPDYLVQEALPATPEKTVASFRDKPLDFKPGEKFNYSNSGYVLLGHLIEKITGGSYEKFLQENIFTPLGMKDSGCDSDTAVIPRRAAEYIPGKQGPEHVGFFHMAFSAGGLYSTTEDLLRWEQGLFGGKLLSTGSLAKMISPANPEPFPNGDYWIKNYGYAMGVAPGTLSGHKLIQHGGGVGFGKPGLRAFVVYFPDDKLTVIVLANLDIDSVERIARRLAELALGGPGH